MTTASIERNTIKPVAAAPATLITFNALSAKKADILTAVTTLRGKATKHFDTYVVKGRKAMLQLLSEIYGAYRAAVDAGQIAALVADLKEKLKAEETTVPANASDCSVLIRYIFSNFTPKQIYTYSRTLEIASNKQTAPADFIAFVEKAGGMEKLCADNRVNGGDSAMATAVVTAINMAKNAPATQTIPVANWASTDKARIFIGIPDGNGMLKLVDTNMSEKSVDATLNRYRIDTEEAKKAKEAASKEADAVAASKLVIEMAVERQAKAHLRVLTAEQELANATAANSKQRQVTATARLMVAQETLEEADAELAELTEKFNPQAVA